MKEDSNILKTIARNDGLKAPEGYFGDFAARMAAALPERPELAAMGVAAPPRTLWGRVRPYVYMAAMFAGVWCMLKMFTTVAGTGKLGPMESNPVIAAAFADDDFMNAYVLDDVSDLDIMDQMMEDGFDPASLKSEFNEPEQ